MIFLLIIIDVFARFMWVEPLENKLEDTVINAFQCKFCGESYTDIEKIFMGI